MTGGCSNFCIGHILGGTAVFFSKVKFGGAYVFASLFFSK